MKNKSFFVSNWNHIWSTIRRIQSIILCLNSTSKISNRHLQMKGSSRDLQNWVCTNLNVIYGYICFSYQAIKHIIVAFQTSFSSEKTENAFMIIPLSITIPQRKLFLENVFSLVDAFDYKSNLVLQFLCITE